MMVMAIEHSKPDDMTLLVFPGKADSVILLDFECTINPENLIIIVVANF